jgi:hypothetical protein
LQPNPFAMLTFMQSLFHYRFPFQDGKLGFFNLAIFDLSQTTVKFIPPNGRSI